MKRPKKPQKKEGSKVRSPRESQELSDDQLERVAGGAAGAGGDRPTESLSLNFTKISNNY